nr:Imm50 family immunity protein [uncultured Roseateles sp.]
MIGNADQLVSYFGYWPEFCDAKIVLISFEPQSSIVMRIAYIDVDRGCAATIELKFSGVSEIALTDLLSENVIDSLRLSQGSPVRVILDACYGLQGSFTCQAVEVSSLQPDHSYSPSPSPQGGVQ